MTNLADAIVMTAIYNANELEASLDGLARLSRAEFAAHYDEAICWDFLPEIVETAQRLLERPYSFGAMRDLGIA